MKTKRGVRRCTQKRDSASCLNRDATVKDKETCQHHLSTMMVGGLSRASRWSRVLILIYAVLRRESDLGAVIKNWDA